MEHRFHLITAPVYQFGFGTVIRNGLCWMLRPQVSLYASGLALLEQNLHTLDSQGLFETRSLEQVIMAAREPLEWHFKQLDHTVGLSFKVPPQDTIAKY